MKKIIFIIIALLAAGTLLIINKGNLMSKENLMDNTNTYTVIAPNGMEIPFDKKTNLIIAEKNPNMQLAPDLAAKLVLDSRSILDSSPYKNYKPLYYNPKPNSLGQTDYLSFKPWLDISYKPSSTVKRSNLKCTMIDIPEDAIGRVDSSGKLTKPEYAEIYDEVDRNKNTLKSELFIGEWGICAGVLGDSESLGNGNEGGFKAREFQAVFLAAQLGVVEALHVLADCFKYYTYTVGVNKNLDTYEKILKLYKNPPLDEYGMIPYLDEIVGSYFVMDFNRGGVINNADGSFHKRLRKLVEDEGKLLDPRDLDANETTREEFVNYIKSHMSEFQEEYGKGAFPNRWSEKDLSLYIDSALLEAKIMSLTPPEGYPNAPYYNTPEELTRLYEAGKLDKKLNPLTPVMYRDSFPEDLRQKILSHAKEHNIKD